MKIKFDVIVKTVEKVDRRREGIESKFYKLHAKDEDGVTIINIVTPKDFNGLKPGEVVRITLDNPQKTL